MENTSKSKTTQCRNKISTSSSFGSRNTNPAMYCYCTFVIQKTLYIFLWVSAETPLTPTGITRMAYDKEESFINAAMAFVCMQFHKFIVVLVLAPNVNSS